MPIPPDLVVVYAEDVTERTEAERRQEQLAGAERLRAMGQLASGMAHDLNQSLAIILGYGELAAEHLAASPPDVGALREELGLITRAAADGGETVRRLLTFARGTPEAPPEAVDLAVLLADVGKLSAPRWRDAARAEGRVIRLSTEAEGDARITGWPSGIREAVMNLVFNAVDALPAGGEIRLVAAQRGAHVEVAVSDDGEGMPAEVRARVFEPFFTTKGEGGTGLGLSQVFGIVEQHGGHVAVDSAAGRGTTVRLVFPRGLPARGDRARGVPARGSGLEGAPRALRILAVDDEPTLAGLLAHMLHRDGHAVAVAHSGEAALEVLDRGPFDLVVSDLGMGGISGWDLAEQVRARRPGLPFVLATGWGAEIDPDEARRRGVAAVLAKPYRLAELRRVVRDIGPATERPP